MKNLDELREEYIVLKTENSEADYYITLRKNFTEMNVCDTYSNYGLQVGHYDAEDYLAGESCTEADNACIQAYNDNGRAEKGDIWEDIDDIDDIPAPAIEDWNEINAFINTCIAWTFWDGGNNVTFVLSDYEYDYNEVSEDETLKVLSEFAGAAHGSPTGSYETDSFVFESSCYADDPWIATVKVR